MKKILKYVRKIRSRQRHGYYDRRINKRNQLHKIPSTIINHIIETTVRHEGLNSSTNG